ncbi:MAG: hypothetical protein JO235_06555 [Chroococcidiopsidaceae cyanobacterium CP_BM_RX_35]|nr:hypothetical protein [Chroococcidiopsidaceae cyanobacterium CP_BM_RX_35]
MPRLLVAGIEILAPRNFYLREKAAIMAYSNWGGARYIEYDPFCSTMEFM